MVSSPELTGGAGFSFEDASVSIYLVALLGEESGPGLSNRIVTRVAVQQAAFDELLDDLIVDSKAADGTPARLSLQVKRSLTISAASSNKDFTETVSRAWATISKSDFREDIDRVGVVTGTISEASRRAFNEVCEWARDSTTVETFIQRFDALGFAGTDRKNALESFRQLLTGAPDVTNVDAAAYRLFRHFVLISFSVLTEGSTDDASAIERLRYRLHSQDQHRAADLWAQILTIARSAAGRAGEFDRPAIIRKLNCAYRLAGAPSLQAALMRLDEEASFGLADIRSAIDGFEIPREAVKSDIEEAAKSHRFVQIVGLPGTGKSAALKEYAESKRTHGNVLFLKSDRLSGTNWLTYAQSLGISAAPLETLLTEISATGTSILFIDGLDRIAVSQRTIVTDLIGSIIRTEALGNWKIVATLRDNGIEPLRTWLPPALFKEAGIATVEVKAFDDDEADILAEAKPALKPLLFGDSRVRDIARRAFFADVLARALPQTTGSNAPTSETGLIDAWWLRGGYNSDGSRAASRQRALIKLAQAGASTPHRRIKVDGIDTDALEELKSDGIVRDGRAGHTVLFTHDIFFEWSFLHVLFEHEEDWIAQIKAAGEAPVLARTVELMSQATISDFGQWESHLAAFEAANVRPQWTRAWLTAAFSSAQFRVNEDEFTDAMLRNDAKHLAQLAVWFQAEKTKPNPNVLNRINSDKSLSRREIIRHADLLAWPSDVASWRRFLGWIMRHVERIPATVIPDILSAFHVWQNIAADIDNSLSKDIIGIVAAWLEDLEDHEHKEELDFNHGRWAALDGDERDELEERLRGMLLRSARGERERVSKYLTRVAGRKSLRNEAFNNIAGWANILSENHAKELVELTLAAFKRELPEEIAARKDQWQIMGRSFDPFDHHEMSIGEPKGGYFPASPIREPFVSLFEKAPDEARSLVSELSNHSITAWRQLNKLSYRNHATPIPMPLAFPWGTQVFWGDKRIYMWARGQWGPESVSCGLMSLERWAFAEVEKGRDVDDVIRDVVSGHDGCAVLNIAATLIVESQRVSATTLPIFTSQRIWHWDVACASSGAETTNLIGFMRPSDMPHAKAVQELNLRPSRKNPIHLLAMLFVLNHDENLRTAAQTAIQHFPDDLPFDYEEEKTANDHVASLRRTAEIWAEAGKIDNYKAEPTPDGKHIKIELANPTASDPDVVASKQRSALMNDQLTVLNWVLDSFEKKAVSDRLTLADAFARAHQRHRVMLFRRKHNNDFELDQDQSLVAGTAAIAVLYGGELASADLKRCAKILLHAYKTPEHTGGFWSSGSALLHHPALFSARGLAGLIRRNIRADEAKAALISLAGHPLEEVSAAAFKSAFSVWDIDPNFSWLAFNLAIDVCTGIHGKPISPYGYDQSSRLDRIVKATSKALRDLSSGAVIDTAHPLPKPWVFAPHPRFADAGDDDPNAKPIWREPDEFLRWDFLPKLLKFLPINEIMADMARRPAFLAFCQELLAWMIERIKPSWVTEDERKRRDRDPENFHDLKRVAMNMFAQVAVHLDLGESKRIFLDPVFALGDDESASLLHSFVNWLAITDVLDTPQISPRTIPLLQACLGRILKDHSWSSARRRSGQLHGFDLPYMVRLFTFTSVETATLAARFANGDWRDIQTILPLIDQFVLQVGDISTVTHSYLTLVERAFEHYPPEMFVEQVALIIEKQPRTPVGWRGSSIPSRIAGLIHAFAEKQQPLPASMAQTMLRILDRLVDMGDRRSAALQASEVFKDIRFAA